MTPPITTARIVVSDGAPREVWMQERGEGVTASEAWPVARAGIRARRRILEQKMNGSTFKGSKATRAGSAREAALLDEAAERLVSLTPNGALWGAVGNDLHRATPDGIGVDTDSALVVVEVKSHEHGWESDEIPVEHFAQMQWQIHVLGADYALYGFEVRDEDDMPPAEGATWIAVERDDEMIAYLIDRADDFIAWRDAGCPDVDGLPDDLVAAIAEWAPNKRTIDASTKAEKAGKAKVSKALGKLPHAARFGAVGMTVHGGFQASVSESTSIDEDEWKADAPDVYARVQQMKADVALLEAAAKATYPKVRRTMSIRFQEVEAADV